MGTRNRWLLPLCLAAALALVFGSIEAFPTISSNDYFGYHLFYTGFRSLSSRVDWFAFIFAFTFYLLWLGYRVAGLIKRAVARRVAVAIVESGILLGCILLFNCERYFTSAGIALVSGMGRMWAAIQNSLTEVFNRDMFEAMISVGLPQLVLVLLLILGGTLALIVFRRRANRKNEPKQAQPSISRVHRPMPVIPLIQLFTVPFVIVFLVVNLAVGALWIRNAVLLRNRPNVVFIMIDAARADHMGWRGYARKTTPNLDSLAKDSLRFRHAVSQASWTTWSVGSLMTSQYPQAMNLGDGEHPGSIDRSFVTLAEVLKEYGYVTDGVISNGMAGSGMAFDQGYDAFDQSSQGTRDYAPNVYSQSMRLLSGLKGKRFFLFGLYLDPHDPYRQHGRFSFDPGYRGKYMDNVVPRLDKYRAHEYTDADIEHMKALYDSGIAYADDYTGKLLSELKKRGLYDNTLIVFFADHGEEFTEHGDFVHTKTLYNELVDVPLLIKLPRNRNTASVGGIFPLIDLFPSVMRFLSIDTSHLRLLGDTEDLQSLRTCREKPIYSATLYPDYNRELRAVIAYPYKFIVNLDTNEEELYNDMVDPAERNNIVAEEPNMARKLRKLVLSHETEVMESGVGGPSMPTNTLSAADKERLRSLGYMK